MVEKPKPARSSADRTRAALIAAGLKLFGEKGYEATSTRDIAARADANIASIAYHFGGKDGLRVACARAIVEKVRGVAGSAILASNPDADSETALAVVEMALGNMIRFITVEPEARDIAAFVIREMANPGAVVDLIYKELMYPVHVMLCRLWGKAIDDDPESPATRLAVFALIGQVIYFRLAQPIVLKRMDWERIGPDEADRIAATIIGHLRKIAAGETEAKDV